MDFEFVDAGIGGLLAHVGVFALTGGWKTCRASVPVAGVGHGP